MPDRLKARLLALSHQLQAARGRVHGWVQDPRREGQVFLVLTLVIGAIVGLAVVAFIVLTENLGARMYPGTGAAWRRVLVPTIGALVTGYLLYRFFPDARGSGIPQTKAALFVRDGHISLGTVLGKFFCTSASLASGIPLGREGPAVQVGAGIASVLGRAVGLRRERARSLVPVGASAALAAAFNTPLSAVLFALEEVMGNMHAPVLGSVVLAAATSWMVLRLFLGNEPLFHVPQYELLHPVELIFYALLGILGGLVSVGFVKLLLRLRARFLRWPERTRWVQPVVGGLFVGLLGWGVPQVLGVGYTFVGQALNGQLVFSVMAALVVLKLVAVATSYASGNAGGVFGPSLFLGAMVGGTVGSVAHWLLPEITAGPGTYALVGMGTAFAGIIRVPFTSVVMIFELTRDYTIIVPLMISATVSYFVSHRFQKVPIYEALALQDGIHLPSSSREARRHRPVQRAMRPAPSLLPSECSVAEAVERVRAGENHSSPVVSSQGLIGVVSLVQLEKQVAEGHAGRALIELLDRTTFPHVHPDQSLELALERLGSAGLDLLPVVNRGNVHELLGVVTLADVLASYGLAGRR